MTESEARLNEIRRATLIGCGADRTVLEELLAYTENPYSDAGNGCESKLPMGDEPHLAAWENYAEDARVRGVIPALSERFTQLRFPIREGISGSDDYRAATRRGRAELADAHAPGVVFENAPGITLSIHETIAGRIPVLTAASRNDFISLVRAFSSRNEPEPIPSSMGACIVTGLNNWDRIRSFRKAWEEREAEGATEERWQTVFREELAPRKPLYQDRLVILSSGPYSDCDAKSVGFDEDEWRRLSVSIRREHEFTHYFTYRAFGSMRNHILDELLADFVGLIRVLGAYDAKRAATFLGLERHPEFRKGGRLENYCPEVSAEAFRVLQCLAYGAIATLDALAASHASELQSLEGLAKVVYKLCRLTLEELAIGDLRGA